MDSLTTAADTEDITKTAEESAPSIPADYAGYGRRRLRLMRNEQWLIYCLPFLVYMVFGFFEPVGPTKGIFAKEPGLIGYNLYPFVYSLKIGLTCLTMVWVWPGYRLFPWRFHSISIIVGIVGAVLWVAINKYQMHLNLSAETLGHWGLGSLAKLGVRPGFNPLDQLSDQPALAWSFLGIRFFGLVIVVPIIEEFFLRGFLMRYVIHIDWWTVPFAKVTPLALLVGTGVPMLMHPQEMVAAAVWFSMVTWLMIYTKSIWDCIVAHATTNLLMGLWVAYSGDWWLM